MKLSSTSTNHLNQIFTNYVDATETKNTKRMHPTASSIQLVIDELGIQKQNIRNIRIEESKNPIAVPVHADTPAGFTTTLIPLKFASPVWTIVFTSYYNGNNTAGYKYRPTNQQYYENEWLSTDHHHVDNITDKDIDQSDYEKYLSFLQKEDLHGLSIAKSIPWQLSGVIQFPSHQLHSGSTFEGSKRWLLIASVTNT